MSYLQDGFVYYKNPRPVAYREEKHAPVPGWGVQPMMAGPPWLGYGGIGGYGDERLAGDGGIYGLGTEFTIGTPIGNQKIDVPIDKMASAAVSSAYPKIEERIINELVPKMAPGLMAAFEPKIKQQVNVAITQAKAYAAAEEKKAIGWAMVAGAVIVGSIWGAAWWARQKK
jgi:hypothetical protein